MNDGIDTSPERRDRARSLNPTGDSFPARGSAAQLAIFACVAVYCAITIALPQALWPDVLENSAGAVGRWSHTRISDLLTFLDINRRWNHAVKLTVVSGLIPWLAMAAIGRWRPSELGTRIPNRYGWRVLVVAYVIAMPFLFWMVRGADFAETYLLKWRQSASIFLGYYFINMLWEHFLFHGVMLAAFRGDRRWPAAAPIDSAPRTGWIRPLHWIGLAQTRGKSDDASDGAWQRAIRWLGLPHGCVFAIVGSGLLFGFIHWGKDARELVLSLPGGMAMAYLAYRTNSWLVPFLLHLATAGTAFIILLATA